MSTDTKYAENVETSPSINFCQNLRRLLFVMVDVNPLFYPGDQVILESPLDNLMK